MNTNEYACEAQTDENGPKWTTDRNPCGVDDSYRVRCRLSRNERTALGYYLVIYWLCVSESIVGIGFLENRWKSEAYEI